MTYPHGGAGQIWRDHQVSGDTLTPIHNPDKAQIRDWGKVIEGLAGFPSLSALADATSGSMPVGTLVKVGLTLYTVADPAAEDFHHQTSGGLKLYNLTPLHLAPMLTQTAVCEPFLGFDDGITDTAIFPGANRAPQGLEYLEVNGVKKLFVLQRVAGSSYEEDERHRIVEYNYSDDGTVLQPVAWSQELNLGHGQDLSGVIENGDVYFYCQGATLQGHTGTDAGKAVSRVHWRGAATSQADVRRIQVFGDEGSGHIFERFNKATVGVCPDGLKLVLFANDVKGVVDDLGHSMFVWDLVELLAAADPLTVRPIAGPIPITPQPHNRTFTLQGCAPGPERIAVVRGYTNAFEAKAIEIYDYAGNLDRMVYFDGPRGDYTAAELLDHPTLGVPYSFEPEGITWIGNELLVQFDEVWRDVGDVVSWQGKNWACLDAGVTDKLPCEGDYWVKTSKAASGPYDPATSYARGAEYTRKSKRIYRIGIERGQAGEQPLMNGTSNLLPVGRALGENGVDVSHRFLREFSVLAYCEALGQYFRSFGYYAQHVLNIYDQRDGADNDNYGMVGVTHFEGRQILELRASRGSNDRGGWMNYYGDEDSDYPGWMRGGGAVGGVTKLGIEYDPVADASRLKNPIIDALYESDWTAVASNTAYDFAHGLVAAFADHPFGPLDASDLAVFLWFRDGSGNVFQIPYGYTHSTSNETGPSVWHKDANTLQVAFGNDGVYAHDNTDLSSSVTLETTGDLKVKILVMK